MWLAVSTVGQPNVLRGALLVLSLLLAVRRRWVPSAALLMTALVEWLAAPSSKLLLNRDRPVWTHPLATEPTTSYPSGHAAAAGMFAVALMLLASHALMSRTARLAVGVAACVGCVLVAASRVFLGVHYLSDVVGGLLLGATVACACWLVASLLARRAVQLRPRRG